MTHTEARRYPTLGLKPEQIRAYLGRFGLSGHHHLQPICKLSGGQKARVVFTSICLANPHILLLDEPTNHLDMQSIDALADALQAVPLLSLRFVSGCLCTAQRLLFVFCDRDVKKRLPRERHSFKSWIDPRCRGGRRCTATRSRADSQRMLVQFAGGVVVISHNSQLLSTVCDDAERSEVWLVENGEVETYDGYFQDYKDELMREISDELDQEEEIYQRPDAIPCA